MKSGRYPGLPSLSLSKLRELVSDIRKLYEQMASSNESTSSLAQQTANVLTAGPLLPNRLTGYFSALGASAMGTVILRCRFADLRLGANRERGGRAPAERKDSNIEK
jgi:hypothetical protein